MSSQIVMTYANKRPNTALPYAFTEQGVAMLSGILNSDSLFKIYKCRHNQLHGNGLKEIESGQTILESSLLRP